MKTLLTLFALTLSLNAQAGGMRQIPAQLMEMDHLARATFLKNAVESLGTALESVKYADMNTIVVGGDEKGSDNLGGYFIVDAELSFRDASGAFQRQKCHQFLVVGSFVTSHPHLTRPVVCEKL